MSPWKWSPSTLTRRGDPSLAYQVIAAQAPVRARLILVHGQGEYAYRYRTTVEAFCERGIAVATFDLRGHGDSEGVRGHVARFQDYVDDVLAVLDRVETEPGFANGPAPVVFGHSLGGLIAIHVALQKPGRVLGVVLSSPFLGLSLPVPLIERTLARALARLLPTFTRPTRIRGSQLTRDADCARTSDADERRVRVASARFFVEAKRAQIRALESAPEMARPVFCVQAGDDLVASASATEDFMRRVRTAGSKLEVVPEARHEILNDLAGKEWTQKLGEVVLSMANANGRDPRGLSERDSDACA